MNCECELMKFVNAFEQVEWEDDIPVFSLLKDYECVSCGKTVTVDATEEVCENQY